MCFISSFDLSVVTLVLVFFVVVCDIQSSGPLCLVHVGTLIPLFPSVHRPGELQKPFCKYMIELPCYFNSTQLYGSSNSVISWGRN